MTKPTPRILETHRLITTGSKAQDKPVPQAPAPKPKVPMPPQEEPAPKSPLQDLLKQAALTLQEMGMKNARNPHSKEAA